MNATINATTIKKPEQTAESTWQQHLEWMSVMGETLKDNFARHKARVKQDAKRAKALQKRHQQVLESEPRVQSLFCQ
ncbi:MAG: hypothetical protein NXI15_00055 [Gammaproteobacteria bacterium]|jgi:hypothetical protein|nr:hypothetical protein [Gammaproteobacteria bacterium]